MTFWLIAVPTAGALLALIWWRSGRARPDRRRRSLRTEIAMRETSTRGYEARGDGGPQGGGFGF